MQYIDITDILKRNKNFFKIIDQNYYVDDNGNRYNVDNNHVLFKPTDREREIASILGELYGGIISLLPVVLYPLRNKNS